MGSSISSGGTHVLQCQHRLLANTQDIHLMMQLLAKSLVCCPLTMLLSAATTVLNAQEW